MLQVVLAGIVPPESARELALIAPVTFPLQPALTLAPVKAAVVVLTSFPPAPTAG